MVVVALIFRVSNKKVGRKEEERSYRSKLVRTKGERDDEEQQWRKPWSIFSWEMEGVSTEVKGTQGWGSISAKEGRRWRLDILQLGWL